MIKKILLCSSLIVFFNISSSFAYGIWQRDYSIYRVPLKDIKKKLQDFSEEFPENLVWEANMVDGECIYRQQFHSGFYYNYRHEITFEYRLPDLNCIISFVFFQ